MTEDCDQHIFLNEGHAKDCTCVNHLHYINGIVELELTEEEKVVLEQSKYVKQISIEREVEPDSLRFEQRTTAFRTRESMNNTLDGTDFSPMMFALASNTGDENASSAGYFTEDGEDTVVSNQKITQTFKGDYIDIVAMEAGTPSSFYNDIIDHPDFLDDQGNRRFIPEDWGDYDGVQDGANSQITNGYYFSNHAIGVLSAVGGSYCGWPKNSTLRVIYLSGSGGTFSGVANAIIAWHNQKPINPVTGKRNATVVTGSWGYVGADGFDYAIRPDQINQINTFDAQGQTVTITRPGASWGTDLSSFTDNHIYPRTLSLSDSGNTEWIIPCGIGLRYTGFDTICQSMANNNCYFFKSMGNSSDISSKPGHYLYNTDLQVDANHDRFELFGSGSVSGSLTVVAGTGVYYPLIHYTNGGDNAFFVSACQQSDANPFMDPYSSRGPSADISGFGAYTYTAYVSGGADSNGWYWGYFSGTSCAAPNVAGVAAVVLEWWLHKNLDWPTISELKTYLLDNAEDVISGVEIVDFSATPAATDSFSSNRFYSSRSTNHYDCFIGSNTNGGQNFPAQAGTPAKRVFLPDEVRVGRGHTIRAGRTEKFGTRPATGQAYPRRKIEIEGGVTPSPRYNSLTSSASSINEGDIVTFTLDTSYVISGTTIGYTVSGISASDLSSGSITGNITINSNTGSVSFTLDNDVTTEGSETLTVTLDATDSAGTNTGGLSDSVTVNDTSRTPGPTYDSLTSSASSINEGDTVTFTVSTSNVIDGTTIGYTVSGISASDLSSGSLTGDITINSNTGSVSFTLDNDVTTEGNETLTLTLAATDSASTATGSLDRSVTIIDTSQAPTPTYDVSPAANNVNEGSSLTFNVTTTNVSDGTTLYWTVTNAGDFGTSSGSFTINSDAGSFSVTPTADTTTEGAETFQAQIRTGSTSGTIVDTSTSVTINDTSQTPAFNPDYTITVTNSGNNYLFTGSDRSGSYSNASQPALSFNSGDKVRFSVSASSHPFYIKTSQSTGTGNQVSGATGQGATMGNVDWTTATDGAGTYGYQCSIHFGMWNTITIS
jgi:ribosomal protein L31